jgi:hypothetical protein
VLRRKSTLAFARKHCAQIPTILDALDLPMVPDILDTIDRERGARFVIRAATQLFKTLLGQLRAMRSMLVEPAPALWYSHPEKSIDDFCDEKFNPLFDALGVLHPLLFTDPNKRARTRYQFPSFPTDLNFLLRSIKVQLNRQSKTARDIYYDEPWTYEPGWIADGGKRRSSFDEAGTWREIFMTTGTVHLSEIDQIWKSSNQLTWHCRCPDCSQLFLPLRSHPKDQKTGVSPGGLVYETILRADGLPDEGAIAPTVRYQCPHCATQFPDTPATRLAMNGTAAAPAGAYRGEAVVSDRQRHDLCRARPRPRRSLAHRRPHLETRCRHLGSRVLPPPPAPVSAPRRLPDGFARFPRTLHLGRREEG